MSDGAQLWLTWNTTPAIDAYRNCFWYAGREYQRSLKTSGGLESRDVLGRVEDVTCLRELDQFRLPADSDPAAHIFCDGRLAANSAAPAIVALGKLIGRLPTLRGPRRAAFHHVNFYFDLPLQFPQEVRPSPTSRLASKHSHSLPCVGAAFVVTTTEPIDGPVTSCWHSKRKLHESDDVTSPTSFLRGSCVGCRSPRGGDRFVSNVDSGKTARASGDSSCMLVIRRERQSTVYEIAADNLCNA